MTREENAPNADACVACQRCGKTQLAPVRLEANQVAVCCRCGKALPVRRARHASNQWAGAFAVAALTLLPVALTEPVLVIEQFGHAQSVSIWSGCVKLLSHGEYVVGLAILVCSVLIPIFKLVALVLLSLAEWRSGHKHGARLYEAVELAGRWGMLDVFVVGVLVAILKLGDVMSMRSGPGALIFLVCVLLSLLASAFFDPHAFWNPDDGEPENREPREAEAKPATP